MADKGEGADAGRISETWDKNRARHAGVNGPIALRRHYSPGQLPLSHRCSLSRRERFN